jgi:STE24 endopeptidase
MSVAKNPADKVGQRSRRYSSIKYSLSAVGLVYDLLLLAAALASKVSALLAHAVNLLVGGNYLALPVYLFIICAVYYILSFPLHFYRTFILEHQFQLTRQSLKGWFFDQLKSGAIAYLIGIILLKVFYSLCRFWPQDWWWMVSLFWIFFSLILAKLAPVVIIPLFFKYKKFSDDALRQKIIRLSEKMKVRILDVFEIDLSRQTEKGNAALVGFGSTRRVILGDTLRVKYEPEEIEVILAHEFAHQKLQHLLKLLLNGAVTTGLCFYAIYKTSPLALKLFGLDSLNDIASLPLILMYILLAGIILRPWDNFLSRKFEIEADRLAISSTGLKDAFISTMDKLSAQNLSDRNPRPLIKYFFFDHPPIDERIRLARSV